MSEEIEKRETELSEEDAIAYELEGLLQNETDQKFRVVENGGTYEIDADTFFLTFTIEDDLFEIRSIEARGEAGLGSTIIKAVQTIAHEKKLTLIASNVLDTAIGFWEKMNFEPTPIDGEYYWAGEL